jgi:hypothetical protein
MEKKLTIPEQVKVALDGRTQRWLSFEIRMPESILSKKMNKERPFTLDDIRKINTRLNSNIK